MMENMECRHMQNEILCARHVCIPVHVSLLIYLNVVPYIHHYMNNERNKCKRDWQFIILFFIYRSKYNKYINKEQYNKLSITCAFVCFIIHIWWMQGTTFKYIRKLTCTGIHTWRRHKISFCMCRHSIFAIIRESSR